MTSYDLVIRGRGLIDGTFTDVEIGVTDGTIVAIAEHAPDAPVMSGTETITLAADEVLLRLHPFGSRQEQEAATLAAECPVEERDTTEAEATLAWVRDLDVDTDIGDNDYLWNLYAACSLGTWASSRPRSAGWTCARPAPTSAGRATRSARS